MTAEPARPFDAPWQARAFALVVSLHQSGLFSWGEWTRTLSESIAADPGRPYYESWLDALQVAVTARAAITASVIAETHQAWLDAAARTPHGVPIELERPAESAASA